MVQSFIGVVGFKQRRAGNQYSSCGRATSGRLGRKSESATSSKSKPTRGQESQSSLVDQSEYFCSAEPKHPRGSRAQYASRARTQCPGDSAAEHRSRSKSKCPRGARSERAGATECDGAGFNPHEQCWGSCSIGPDLEKMGVRRAMGGGDFHLQGRRRDRLSQDMSSKEPPRFALARNRSHPVECPVGRVGMVPRFFHVIQMPSAMRSNSCRMISLSWMVSSWPPHSNHQ